MNRSIRSNDDIFKLTFQCIDRYVRMTTFLSWLSSVSIYTFGWLKWFKESFQCIDRYVRLTKFLSLLSSISIDTFWWSKMFKWTFNCINRYVRMNKIFVDYLVYQSIRYDVQKFKVYFPVYRSIRSDAQNCLSWLSNVSIDTLWWPKKFKLTFHCIDRYVRMTKIF
jgi:hypothetical protein